MIVISSGERPKTLRINKMNQAQNETNKWAIDGQNKAIKKAEWFESQAALPTTSPEKAKWYTNQAQIQRGHAKNLYVTL